MPLGSLRSARHAILSSILVLAFFSPGHAQDNVAAPMPLGQLVDIGGRRLHLHCTGAGGPTVVVENGSSSFSIDWALVQSRVTAFTRICTYDRAGFAWSDRGPEENTVEETMDDLHLLLSSASVAAPYVLVGQSIGGMYVRAYQRRYPADVVGLVLVDATPEEDLEYMEREVHRGRLPQLRRPRLTLRAAHQEPAAAARAAHRGRRAG